MTPNLVLFSWGGGIQIFPEAEVMLKNEEIFLTLISKKYTFKFRKDLITIL